MLLNPKIALLIFYIIISIITISLFNGTGDDGDSIMHYLFAKEAPLNPSLYFDHWAKPVYVLFSSPFAQFGFVGVKVFNAIVSMITLLVTVQTAEKLKLPNSVLSGVFLLFAPLFYVLTYSGLTEPLFALFVILGVYWVLSDRLLAASVLISFLPFVRSEGLIFIGIFALYFLLKRNWKAIAALSVGHIIYSFAGYFVFKDILWVFNKIPYARINGVYGSGELFHFVEQLIFVAGVPIYILFWIGVFEIVIKIVRGKVNLDYGILIFLGFFAFLFAHTTFWYFGLFNSMGLKRVFVGVMPLMAIIALHGFNFLMFDLLHNFNKTKQFVKFILIAFVLVFPFTSNPAAIKWDKDLSLSKSQLLIQEIGRFIQKEKLPENTKLYTSHPYISQVLNLNHFDKAQRLDMSTPNLALSKSGDIIIWDNWFSIVEDQISNDVFENKANYINIYSVKGQDQGKELSFIVYQKK